MGLMGLGGVYLRVRQRRERRKKERLKIPQQIGYRWIHPRVDTSQDVISCRGNLHVTQGQMSA